MSDFVNQNGDKKQLTDEIIGQRLTGRFIKLSNVPYIEPNTISVDDEIAKSSRRSNNEANPEHPKIKTQRLTSEKMKSLITYSVTETEKGLSSDAQSSGTTCCT